MRTTGIITEEVYREFVRFRVKRKRGSVKAQTLTDETAKRIYYIMVLFPGIFFVTGHFVFHLGLLPAAVIAFLWFASFFIAGLLYHGAIVGLATKPPPGLDIGKPREYAIESGWLVSRSAGMENRISLSRAEDLVVTETVSFLLCGDFGPILLPFGSGSQPDQRAFLDALRKEIGQAQQAV